MTAGPPDPQDPTVDGGPGFDEALAELEGIVAELESDRLEVDQLAARVERAAELVRTCRERIDGTRLQVDEILERLTDDPSRDGPSTDDGDPAGDG